jgi:hypothetical protein
MAYTGIRIYAGETKADMAELPSPVELTPSRELIWSENTGRGQEGADKAEMVGSVVGRKITYSIKWGILPYGDGSTTRDCFQRILTLLNTAGENGFFYFGIGQSLSEAKSNAIIGYRSNIDYSYLIVGSTTYYKDISVQIIQK